MNTRLHRTTTWRRWLWLPLLGLLSAAAAATPVVAASAASTLPLPEEQLIAAIELARAGRPADSIRSLEALLDRQPNFRLAQLIYADLLASRSGLRGIMADDQDPRIGELFEEARLRLDRARFSPPTGSVPDAVLQLSREYPYLVLIDLPGARMHLMRNVDGVLQSVGSRYAAMGRAGYGKQIEGDLRTPVGVYQITGWMGDEALPELYGTGALPLNYPNLWDRSKAKTGHGIWLHGVPRQTYVRAPRSSEGCVTFANDDLLWLKSHVHKNRTPVVLAENLHWVSEHKLRQEREAWSARIEAWRAAWSARDTETYLSYYGDDFSTAGVSRSGFAEHKRRVNAAKQYVSVKLSDLSLFRYPGESMVLAQFTMDYDSNDFRFKARKEQYWRQDARGHWRIFREENR